VRENVEHNELICPLANFDCSGNLLFIDPLAVLRSRGKLLIKSNVKLGANGTRLLSTKVDSFLSGSSSVYIEQMYESWKKDPKR
jgi:hypothetical protein